LPNQCRKNDEKLNKTKRKKKERKGIRREGGLTVGVTARPNTLKSLANIKVHCRLHTSLHISLHCNQILKIFLEKWTVKMLQPDEKAAKELLKR
jgi:hypothetical protein